MTTEKIRIKDIARLSGVSVGTVDRVLHNRPNVSPVAREKVEKALKEMDYRPMPVLSPTTSHTDSFVSSLNMNQRPIGRRLKRALRMPVNAEETLM